MIKKTYIPGKPRNPKLTQTTGTSGVSKTEFNNVAGSSHEHYNKGVLDQITEAMLIGALRDMITSTDEETELTDDNILSSLRVLAEIAKNNEAFLEELRDLFLSKVEPDTAQKLIKFVEGLEVGTFNSGFLGSGAALKMNNGVSELEVDKLTVRMVATFFELIISKLSHIGGQLILTPARMKCNKVVDGGAYYKCYFDTGDGEVTNEFVAGDLARCQVFTGSGTKFYWRLVTLVGEDWINLSKTTAAVGSDAPEAGDDITQLGNATDTTRQSAIILSTVGIDAPSWKQYSGINSFSLEGKETTVFSKLGNRISGETVFTSGGANLDDHLDGVAQDILDALQAAQDAEDKAQQAIEDAEASVATINTEVGKLQAQLDGEVSNWFYAYSPTLANYPASDWTTNDIKDRHVGDTFTNTAQAPATDAGKSWRFVKNGSTYSWTVIADSDAVKALLEASKAQATADGKSTTHLFQPTKYKLGDMWVLNADQAVNGILYKQGDILTATQDSETFIQSHWLKRIRYTDDTKANQALSSLTNFTDTVFPQEKNQLQSQIDGKIETHFTATDPATAWTTADLKTKHTGDLWYNATTKELKRYSGTAWVLVEDKKAIDAFDTASLAKDTADGKRRVFTSTPTVPYDVGDLWAQGTSGDLMRCATAKTSAQTYNVADWVKASKYTDDTAIDELEIGGRNLFQKAHLLNPVHSGLLGAPTMGGATYPNGMYFAGGDNGRIGYIRFNRVIKGNGLYTLSFKFRGNQGASIGLRANICGNLSTEFISNNTNTFGNVVSFTANVTNYQEGVNDFIQFQYLNYVYYIVDDIKVEKGSKATDWSPAPEDVEANIEWFTANSQVGGSNLSGSISQYTLGTGWTRNGDTLSNLTTSTYNHCSSPNFNLIAGKTYILSFEVDEIVGVGRVQVVTNSTNTTFRILTVKQGKHALLIAPTVSEVSHIRVYGDTSTRYIISNIKLNEAITDRVEKVKLTAEQAQLSAADAQAKANKSAAITDKFATEINGGLITTVMMLLREADTQDVTAGHSGIQGALKNLPAYWAGGTYQQALTNLAKAIIRHDGTVKFTDAEITGVINALSGSIGHLTIEELGRVVMKDPATAKERLIFANQDIPTVAYLEDQTQDGGSTAIGNLSVTTSTPSVSSSVLNVTQNNATLSFAGATMNLQATAPTGQGVTVQLTLTLERNSTPYLTLGGVNVYVESGQTASDSLVVAPMTWSGLPSGSYRIKLERTYLGTLTSLAGTSTSSTLSWAFSKNVEWFQFGLNGMMSWWQNVHAYFSNSEISFRAPSDKWNAPGVLLSATVFATGGFTSWWGAKKHASLTATKNSVGRYTVYHSIGHSDYQITATPTTANRSCHVVSQGDNNFVIEWRSIGSSPALSDTGFHFQITGNNY